MNCANAKNAKKEWIPLNLASASLVGGFAHACNTLFLLSGQNVSLKSTQIPNIIYHVIKQALSILTFGKLKLFGRPKNK